jgi:hypothetical protein
LVPERAVKAAFSRNRSVVFRASRCRSWALRRKSCRFLRVGALGKLDLAYEYAQLGAIRKHVFVNAFVLTLDPDSDGAGSLVGGELQPISIS